MNFTIENKLCFGFFVHLGFAAYWITNVESSLLTENDKNNLNDNVRQGLSDSWTEFAIC
jgi:hypothetical protein